MKTPFVAGAFALAATLTTALIGAAPAGAAAGPLTCGATITKNTRLTADLNCDGPIFTIGAPGITVNLDGHTVSSTMVCSPFGFGPCGIETANATGSKLTNGTITGGGVITTYAVTLTRLTMNNAVVTFWGGGAKLASSVLNGGIVHLRAWDQSVVGNTLQGSRIQLYNSEASIARLLITGNKIIDAPGAGIALLARPVMQNDITGEISHNTIVRSAGAGISLNHMIQSFGTFSVHDNRVTDNGGDGIDVSGGIVEGVPFTGGPVTLTGNIAHRNGGHGINAPWTNTASTGILDGGGNIAIGNALTPACIGVVC